MGSVLDEIQLELLVISMGGSSTCTHYVFTKYLFFVHIATYRIDLKLQKDTKRNYASAYVKYKRMKNMENGAERQQNITFIRDHELEIVTLQTC